MQYKVDLHIHSANSGDNDSDPEEVIERAIEIGLDGIAFTEHYSYEASEGIEPLKGKYSGKIAIFRGVEFSAEEGHCLIFGVNTDRIVPKYCPLDRLIVVVSEMGGVLIPAHPYRGINSIGQRLLSLTGITAIEGHNGCNMRPLNNLAIEAAMSMGLPFTGGSDAHRPTDVGSCYTLFDEPVREDNLIELLKSGRFTGIDNRRVSRFMDFFG
jgi:predicted metal-dependent phosphoesterase TrpH